MHVVRLPRGRFSPKAALSPRTRGAEWNHIFLLIGLFLTVFGLMNFAELPLGWKDREPQISRYLEATVGLGPEWAKPVLWADKSVEAALGLAAVVSLLRRDVRWLIASIVGWMGVFIGFTAMDVWAADRAELQEHTLYFAGFSQLLTVIVVMLGAARIQEWLRPVGQAQQEDDVDGHMMLWPRAPVNPLVSPAGRPQVIKVPGSPKWK